MEVPLRPTEPQCTRAHLRACTRVTTVSARLTSFRATAVGDVCHKETLPCLAATAVARKRNRFLHALLLLHGRRLNVRHAGNPHASSTMGAGAQ